MKKRNFILKIILFSLFVSIASPLSAEDTTALPYDSNEFPQGLKDLRRFEIISLGALPFVTLDTTLLYSGIRYANHNFSSEYMPSLSASSSYSPEEQREIMLTSLGICVGIALTDYIVQLVKRSKNNKKSILESEDLTIYPLKNDPDATLITPESVKDSNKTENDSSNPDEINVDNDEVQEVEE